MWRTWKQKWIWWKFQINLDAIYYFLLSKHKIFSIVCWFASSMHKLFSTVCLICKLYWVVVVTVHNCAVEMICGELSEIYRENWNGWELRRVFRGTVHPSTYIKYVYCCVWCVLVVDRDRFSIVRRSCTNCLYIVRMTRQLRWEKMLFLSKCITQNVFLAKECHISLCFIRVLR